MDIEKYYQYTAVSSLNASLISCIPIILLTFVFIGIHSSFTYFLLILPFLFYSIASFTHYYIQKKKGRKTVEAMIPGKVKSILETKTTVLTFLPAPSLRLGIYTGEGTKVGEIRDMKFSAIRWYLPYFLDSLYAKSYGFYNTNNELQYSFTIKKDVIEIRNKEKHPISEIKECPTSKKSVKLFYYSEKCIVMRKSMTYTDYHFEREEGAELAQIKKGWMPKNWTTRLRDSNFPLLTIDHHASDKEIIHIYAIITKIFAYTNH